MQIDSQPDPRKLVSRYDEYMPTTDDLSLIVLKAHLLVEEGLSELARVTLPHPSHLDNARLSFHQLACVVRAVNPRDDDKCWELIFSLNSLRNDLVHRLEPPQLKERLQKLFSIDLQAQPYLDVQIDKTQESILSDAENLKMAVVSCLQFVNALLPQ